MLILGDGITLFVRAMPNKLKVRWRESLAVAARSYPRRRLRAGVKEWRRSPFAEIVDTSRDGEWRLALLDPDGSPESA
ncbi:MAG: hypothetical protein R3F44_01480 [Candidatus Competibacteraceae bacterium]